MGKLSRREKLGQLEIGNKDYAERVSPKIATKENIIMQE